MIWHFIIEATPLAHEFVSGWFYRSAAWHNLGTVTATLKSPQEAFALARADWTAEQQPVFLENGTRVPDAHALVRSDTGQIISTCGARYVPVQNEALIRLAEALREEIELQAVCVLRNSKIVTFSGMIGAHSADVRGDRLRMKLSGVNSFDGSRAVSVLLSAIRIECANTWRAATSDANRHEDRYLKVRHTASAERILQQIPAILDVANHRFTATVAECRAMAAAPANPELVQRILEQTYADELAKPVPVERGSNEMRPRTLADIKPAVEIQRGFENVGLLEGETRGLRDATVWRAFNSITNFYRHRNFQGGVRAEGRRFLSNELGDGAETIDRARLACLTATRA